MSNVSEARSKLIDAASLEMVLNASEEDLFRCIPNGTPNAIVITDLNRLREIIAVSIESYLEVLGEVPEAEVEAMTAKLSAETQAYVDQQLGKVNDQTEKETA